MLKNWRTGELENWRTGELENWRKFVGIEPSDNSCSLNFLSSSRARNERIGDLMANIYLSGRSPIPFSRSAAFYRA
ncbi:hypothetical protein F0256_20605 [Vibrio europaeus]|nr:hypothetical protein [Vibrio europaeus]